MAQYIYNRGLQDVEDAFITTTREILPHYLYWRNQVSRPADRYVQHGTRQEGIALLHWATRRGDTLHSASLSIEHEGGRSLVVARESLHMHVAGPRFEYNLQAILPIRIEAQSPTHTARARAIRRQGLEHLPPLHEWKVCCVRHQPFSTTARRYFVTLYGTDPTGIAVATRVDCSASGFGYWRVAQHRTPQGSQTRKRIGSYWHRQEAGLIITA